VVVGMGASIAGLGGGAEAVVVGVGWHAVLSIVPRFLLASALLHASLPGEVLEAEAVVVGMGWRSALSGIA
jgi:hypothetical protein